ncbi:MAG: sulfatase [Prolixibacteraceae bacterium]|jgi:arylsulfatase A-like enzyme|nr:sulfatase [Prolixibacteraceae bacterium]MBT6006696.1 sulfatase [Prolixibacteraceae bacterium]MBT6765974.1 sulfatase [Prolixibacteraceae bacterium]MBT7000888.1 sulfatase [Prolixibacteraceae bacterium]MBT7397167.1 sulfatase [Prolixibacteraceae bacterium]
MKTSKLGIKSLLLLGIILLSISGFSSTKSGKPNIMWIFIEDASCHISCYGETAIQTPTIDKLASEGIRFENAFVTCPVCSPCRSALVTGMFQTTSGAHNHRSQRNTGKGGENTDYYESYILPKEIPIASQLFEDAGYFSCNGKISNIVGKTDYNFVEKNIYDGISWKESPEGKPFFCQIQLKGGKNRSRIAKTENFKLPPYYYEDDLMREDWKKYLGSWLDTDEDLDQIVADLKKAGVYDNTLIFFLTDHGVSHMRGKQFLYDEGTKVPLIVKFPNNDYKGIVRKDQVMQIDLLPSSLAFAGLPIPENIQGNDIFSDDYKEQIYVFSSRDRCDETTEIIRSVRSEKFKYIRNFLSYRPHAQRNQYKDGKEISKHMRELFNSGKLNELQARFYQPTRPVEELYNLENDPYEINNLAADSKYKSELMKMRSVLYKWMDETNDAGLIPEPILEDLGKKYGNKYTAMKQPELTDIQKRLIQIIESGEKQNNAVLLEKIKAEEPSERYWAVTWLGVNKVNSAKVQVTALTQDKNPSVRIAANLALYKIDQTYNPIPALGKEVNHKNLIVGMYAINAIEQTGIRNDEVKEIAQIASKSKYDFTMRFGKYLMEASNK